MNCILKVGFGVWFCVSAAMPVGAQEPETSPRMREAPKSAGTTPQRTQPASAATQDDGAHGIPVLEGGPSRKPVVVTPRGPATVPAGVNEVERQPRLKVETVLTLMAKSSSNEFVNWDDKITINSPAEGLSLRWSAKGAQPQGIKWVLRDKPVTSYEHPALVSGMSEGSVDGAKKNFSVDLKGHIPAYPPAAPNKYDYWVYVWPVDAKGESIGGNRSHVRVTYTAKAATNFIVPCSSNQDCNSGQVCGKKEQTCVNATFSCEADVLVSVDGSRKDCGAYYCNPKGPTGSDDGMAHCYTSCKDTTQCAPNYVCSEYSTCLPAKGCFVSAECPQGYSCAQSLSDKKMVCVKK